MSNKKNKDEKPYWVKRKELLEAIKHLSSSEKREILIDCPYKDDGIKNMINKLS